MGLKSEIYIDDSRKHPTTYALSHIRRLDLANLYQQEKKRLETEIQKLTQLAETKRENQKVLTLQYYFQTWPLVENLTEAETILLSASDSHTGGSSRSRAGNRAVALFKKQDLQPNPTTGAV